MSLFGKKPNQVIIDDVVPQPVKQVLSTTYFRMELFGPDHRDFELVQDQVDRIQEAFRSSTFTAWEAAEAMQQLAQAATLINPPPFTLAGQLADRGNHAAQIAANTITASKITVDQNGIEVRDADGNLRVRFGTWTAEDSKLTGDELNQIAEDAVDAEIVEATLSVTPSLHPKPGDLYQDAESGNWYVAGPNGEMVLTHPPKGYKGE